MHPNHICSVIFPRYVDREGGSQLLEISLINSLPPNTAIWWQILLTVARTMTFLRKAPSHYLNQC